jgi:hypothetical protein
LVHNETDEMRVIIYMDILRKYENEFLDWFNSTITNMMVNSSIVANETKKTEIQLSLTS